MKTTKEALAQVQAAYRAEVEEVAKNLRKRFGPRGLHGMTEGEAEDYNEKRRPPWYRLEALVSRAFGVDKLSHEDVLLLLAVSKHAEPMTGYGWRTPRGWLAEALTWDVLVVARERGYYTILPGEETDPLTWPICVECGHNHRGKGCFCQCKGFRAAQRVA